jgi:hypothetical protein
MNTKLTAIVVNAIQSLIEGGSNEDVQESIVEDLDASYDAVIVSRRTRNLSDEFPGTTDEGFVFDVTYGEKTHTFSVAIRKESVR